MDLFEAHTKGLPLVIDTGDGGERLAAELFTRDAGGIVFADIGWPTATWHPFHVIDGEVSQDGDGWRVGDAPVRVAFEGEQFYIDYVDWKMWRGTDAGAVFDRETCWAEIKRSGVLDPVTQ